MIDHFFLSVLQRCCFTPLSRSLTLFSEQKSTAFLTFVPFYVRYLFIPAAFKIFFSLTTDFKQFNLCVTWCGFLHVAYAWDSFSFLDQWIYSFSQIGNFLAIISLVFFPSHSGTTVTYIWLPKVVLQLPDALYNYF